MAVFKCKMCGGTIDFQPGDSVGVCDSCGTRQTLPRLDSDRKANLYDRANHFRRNNEFDKAMSIYENILNEDPSDAEAYWSLVLCRYGIEYVEDPATHRRMPTVNRAQFTSIFADENYKEALSYADTLQRSIYEDEAKAIDEIQKGILEISSKEEPFDVFICYKETDANGRRTPDSVLATDLYHQLTNEGFKVFFSRITLEDKLGTAYEPYIFAALNSAKAMVVLGTKPEHFNAVWVKNEWSRYLALIKAGAKKTLIPAYRDMDPYDLPEEFSHLQAQDMSKLGFMQDLIRGIKKIVRTDEPKPTIRETVVQQTAQTNTAPLLRRAFMFLEDGNFASADEYCEKVLDIEPENAEAYLGKLMAELGVRTRDGLKDVAQPFDGRSNYQKALRFGDQKLNAELSGDIAFINERNENARITGIYNSAVHAMDSATTEVAFHKAASQFASIPEYRDAAQRKAKCEEEAEQIRKDRIYKEAQDYYLRSSIEGAQKATELWKSISGWRDSDEKIAAAEKAIERKVEEARAATEKKKKHKRITWITVLLSLVLCIAAVILFFTAILPKQRYETAKMLYDAGKYATAGILFGKAGAYRDAKEKSIDCWDKAAVRDTVAAGGYHTVGLRSDGTVVAAGKKEDGRCNVSGWRDIVAISAGYNHTVGLRSDGTVVAVGSNYSGQCDVSGWKDIVAIAAGDYHTVGLKKDGTVVAVGDNYNGQCEVSGWKDIVAIAAGGSHTVGQKTDGTAVAVGYNINGQCDVSGWTNIVAIAAGHVHTVVLKSDGTVVATGYTKNDQCDVSGWKDIVAISAGGYHTVGLKSDGTVVAVGAKRNSKSGNIDMGQCNVSDWTDIVAISAGYSHTVGLRSDGTVVAAGDSDYGQCDISDWTDIKVPNR